MIRRLNIILGPACNRHCPYCCQAAPADWAKHVPADLEALRRKLRGLSLAGEFRKLDRVAFWGGEPMLYWETVKRLYGMLCDEGIYPEGIYRVATNGDLVDDDYVSFANSIPNWLTTVSWHDGSISEEQWSVLGQLEACNVTHVVTHHWKEELPALHEKYEALGLGFPVQLWPVHAAGQCDPSEFLTDDDVDGAVAWMRKTAKGYDLFSRRLRDGIVQHARKTNRRWPDCGDETALTVDLAGREFACQHNPTPETVASPEILALSRKMREGCEGCPAWDHCGGGCFLSANRRVECYFHKKYVQLGRELNEASA